MSLPTVKSDSVKTSEISSLPVLQQNKVKPNKPENIQTHHPDVQGMRIVENFFRDPFVTSIECRGPDKMLLINKNGRIHNVKQNKISKK